MSKPLLLFLSRCVNALLHNAAAVLVTSYLNVLRAHLVVDKLVLQRVPAMQDFLDDVVAVNVLTHFFKNCLQAVLNHCEMLREMGCLDEFLN